MNAFWKTLVASVVVYQLVLTFCILDILNRAYAEIAAVYNPDAIRGTWDAARTPAWVFLVHDSARENYVILTHALIALVAFNLVGMLYRRATRWLLTA